MNSGNLKVDEGLALIHIKWQNAEKTLLQWTFCGIWTADEFYAALTNCTSWLLDSDHDVDIIVDAKDMHCIIC